MAASTAVDYTEPRSVRPARTKSDNAYRRGAVAAGLTTLVLLVLIGFFLLLQSREALDEMGWSFFTTDVWNPQLEEPEFGIFALLYWTIVIAIIALTIAVPLALLLALYITEYAPRRVKATLTSLVDLLAAIPSLIYGLWGYFFLQPRLMPVAEWMSEHLSFIPFLRVSKDQFPGSSFIAGVVVALMVLPICTAVMREVFSQTPPGEKEAALALGGTRWGMIRTVVLPFGRGGIIGGSMLGLGRALGETIAVAVIISTIFEVNLFWLQTGSNSIAAHIALRFGEADSLTLSGLMAAGLTLFVFTLTVNFLASIVVGRSRSGAGVDA